jgi:hypothetical protein
MIDEQTAPTEGATDQTTMADVANSIKPAESNTPEAAKEVKPSTDNVGDFAAFTDKINALSEKVETTSQQTEALANSRQEENLSKEITEAVGKVSELTGIDSDLIELHLEKRHRVDPDFAKVWDNRHANPEALTKALEIEGREIAAKYPNAIDPAVAENQRALKESQKGGATVQVDSQHQELDKLNSGDFMHFARTLAQDG